MYSQPYAVEATTSRDICKISGKKTTVQNRLPSFQRRPRRRFETSDATKIPLYFFGINRSIKYHAHAIDPFAKYMQIDND
jgi:hypothetical protein